MRTTDRRPAAVVRSATVLAALAAALLAACGGPPPPVAELTFTPAEVTLAYPSSVAAEEGWKLLTPLGEGGEEPIVFVHLRDETGGVARTFDHPFPVAWEVGGEPKVPLVLSQSLLAPPLPAGDYQLTVGLYGPQGRWPLAAGQEVKGREYAVATVHVPAADDAALPKLDFGAGWLDVEPGQDMQVLATRWLSTGGEVVVAAAPRAGRLTFEVEVPPALDGAGPIFAEGAEIPRLNVNSTCDQKAYTISGTGHSRFTVDVPAGGGCTISLQPNFYYQPAGSEKPRSLRLLQLFWD